MVLYRIGRAPDPLVFPPAEKLGRGRFDDPKRRLSVLYATANRRTAFMETIDQFRLDVAGVAELEARIGNSLDPGARKSMGLVPSSYFHRRMARFRLQGSYRWLDVRSPETHALVLREMAGKLAQLGLGPRITLGDLLGSDYRVPQLFTGWAIDHGYNGIIYASCHDLRSECWALFEGIELERLTAPQPIQKDDPDLLAVAGLWNLRVP